jgi:archaellum component FlaG (FlaF/FlaG flagellin family)
MNTKVRNVSFSSLVVRLAALVAAASLVAVTLAGLNSIADSTQSRGARATTVLPTMNIIVVSATRLLPQSVNSTKSM